jgi:uncharacterized membrane protein YbhN (UPF0104 family)
MGLRIGVHKKIAPGVYVGASKNIGGRRRKKAKKAQTPKATTRAQKSGCAIERKTKVVFILTLVVSFLLVFFVTALVMPQGQTPSAWLLLGLPLVLAVIAAIVCRRKARKSWEAENTYEFPADKILTLAEVSTIMDRKQEDIRRLLIKWDCPKQGNSYQIDMQMLQRLKQEL